MEVGNDSVPSGYLGRERKTQEEAYRRREAMQLLRGQDAERNVDEATRRVFTRLFARREGSDQDISFVVERCESGAWFPAHSHDLEQWFFVYRGLMRFIIDGQECLAGPGQLVYVPRKAEHEGRNAVEELTEYLVVDHWPKDSRDALGWQDSGGPVWGTFAS